MTTEEYLTNLFVHPKIGFKLKELGFNYPCFATYGIDDQKIEFIPAPNEKGNDNTGFSSGYCLAPTYDQVVEWFITEHNLLIGVDHDSSNYFWFINDLDKNKIVQGDLESKLSHKETFNLGIEEAIKMKFYVDK